jgi:transcriptional regulator with XRE-family HTH domain
MAYPAYVRDKARRLRIEKHLSIEEIATRLGVPQTTIYDWIRDLPLGRPRRPHRKGNPGFQARCRLRRTAAYALGRLEFERLSRDPTFRDFVCLYIGEGSKRNRNRVAVCNSDPRVIVLCTRWIKRFARNRLHFRVQYHADQDLSALQHFWGEQVGVAPQAIALQRKSNSGQLGGRTWRSQHGVLTVAADDTMFRARLQAWMDCLQEQWLDSPHSGRSAAW